MWVWGTAGREEREAASLTKKVFLASPAWWDLVHPNKLASPRGAQTRPVWPCSWPPIK